MTLIINGQPHDLPHLTSNIPLPSLLAALEIDYPVLVELNGTALHQWEWPQSSAQEGDHLELFRMVAGG